MATGTHAGSTWDTNAGNKTVIATPVANDLVVVVHAMSGWASGDSSTITDNNSDGLGTYTRIGTATTPLSTGGGTNGALWISVRNALVGSATSTTFTATNVGDTGGGLTVLRFSGMTRVGSAAIRQSIGESTQTEAPPTVTFASACLTQNPVILAVFGEDNPANLTPPTGFTEAVDTGWLTPASGIQVCWANSGVTTAGITYSTPGTNLTNHNDVGLELNTSALLVLKDVIGSGITPGPR